MARRHPASVHTQPPLSRRQRVAGDGTGADRRESQVRQLLPQSRNILLVSRPNSLNLFDQVDNLILQRLEDALQGIDQLAGIRAHADSEVVELHEAVVLKPG